MTLHWYITLKNKFAYVFDTVDKQRVVYIVCMFDVLLCELIDVF